METQSEDPWSQEVAGGRIPNTPGSRLRARPHSCRGKKREPCSRPHPHPQGLSGGSDRTKSWGKWRGEPPRPLVSLTWRSAPELVRVRVRTPGLQPCSGLRGRLAPDPAPWPGPAPGPAPPRPAHREPPRQFGQCQASVQPVSGPAPRLKGGSESQGRGSKVSAVCAPGDSEDPRAPSSRLTAFRRPGRVSSPRGKTETPASPRSRSCGAEPGLRPHALPRLAQSVPSRRPGEDLRATESPQVPSAVRGASRGGGQSSRSARPYYLNLPSSEPHSLHL